jgi:hypothetical protein
LLQPAPSWRIEDGSEQGPQQDAEILSHAPLIENQEIDTLWYSQYFINKGSFISTCFPRPTETVKPKIFRLLFRPKRLVADYLV